jgi:hypothetical protein
VKIIIQGREYTAVADDSITLADLVVLKAQTGLSRADLFDLFEQVQGLSEAQMQRSDEALLIAGVSVWLARRHAGEQLTLEEACDVPMGQVEFVREPGDPEPTPAGRPGPTGPHLKGSAPRSTRSPQDRKPKAGARKTSKKASSAGS